MNEEGRVCNLMKACNLAMAFNIRIENRIWHTDIDGNDLKGTAEGGSL